MGGKPKKGGLITMRDRTQHHQKHHQKHHQHHRTQANLISIAVLFIFYLLTPIIVHADQTTPSPTPTSLEIQRATVGIKGKVLANSDYDVIIPIDTYYKVIFDSTGGSAVSMQFVKENCNAIEPAAPTRANYEFNFWVEKRTYEEFNFTTTPITHDITLKAVWTSTSPSSSPSPSDENKPNTDKEDTNSSENTKDTTEDKEDSSDNKDENTEDNGEDSKSKDNKDNSESNENNNGLSNTTEESTETTEATETTEESSDGLINTHTNPSSNNSKTSTPSIETDPDIATNTETTDLLSEIKATVLGVFKTISKSIAIVAKISLIGILIGFIWVVILLNNTLVKIQAPSEDQPDQSQPDQHKRQSKSWKTVYLTPIKKTIEQTDGDKRTVWSLSLPQNLLDENKELKVKIPWSVYHKAEDENQANQTELHITIVNQDQSLPTPTMIYIITNETKEIKIK